MGLDTGGYTYVLGLETARPPLACLDLLYSILLWRIRPISVLGIKHSIQESIKNKSLKLSQMK